MIARHAIGEWMKVGPREVASGATGVQIADRRPDHDSDPLSPEGAYFWYYGWRWLEPEEPSSPHTLPEAVFRCLPECPCEQVAIERKAGCGIAPRWPTAEGAMEALNEAAFRWAREAGSRVTAPTEGGRR